MDPGSMVGQAYVKPHNEVSVFKRSEILARDTVVCYSGCDILL